jgi:hypothetical protein
MKRIHQLIATTSICLSLFTASAQMGPGQGSGPDFSGPMAKLFGEHRAFTATTEVQAKNAMQGGDMVMPGKLSYLEGKSRLELELEKMKGANMTEAVVEQMKQMGMDKMTTISDPEKKLVYMIYPTLKAYAEMPIPNADAKKSDKDLELKVTELGKETVEGHECVKNKAVVTDKEGKTTEFTVWNATDLKKFPVKIAANQKNMDMVMTFKDVKFAKPDAGLFDPPSDYTKYSSIMTLMQQEMMKRMGGMQQGR